jgi:hydroxymethylpyrimidine/phosphomethylpyrimidine kinase
MKFDPAIRCAAVLKYTDRAFEVFEDGLFLSCSTVTPGPSAHGTGPMDWGIASCCREEVPDVIYEKKPDPVQSRLLLFGEGPADVINNIIICLGRI